MPTETTLPIEVKKVNSIGKRISLCFSIKLIVVDALSKIFLKIETTITTTTIKDIILTTLTIPESNFSPLKLINNWVNNETATIINNKGTYSIILLKSKDNIVFNNEP